MYSATVEERYLTSQFPDNYPVYTLDQDARAVHLLPWMTEEEFDDLYEQLDAEHQLEVRQNIREFPDNAVSSPNWDSDKTGGENTG